MKDLLVTTKDGGKHEVRYGHTIFGKVIFEIKPSGENEYFPIPFVMKPPFHPEHLEAERLHGPNLHQLKKGKVIVYEYTKDSVRSTVDIESVEQIK